MVVIDFRQTYFVKSQRAVFRNIFTNRRSEIGDNPRVDPGKGDIRRSRFWRPAQLKSLRPLSGLITSSALHPALQPLLHLPSGWGASGLASTRGACSSWLDRDTEEKKTVLVSFLVFMILTHKIRTDTPTQFSISDESITTQLNFSIVRCVYIFVLIYFPPSVVQLCSKFDFDTIFLESIQSYLHIRLVFQSCNCSSSLIGQKRIEDFYFVYVYKNCMENGGSKNKNVFGSFTVANENLCLLCGCFQPLRKSWILQNQR